jgi:hypothetical protein
MIAFNDPEIGLWESFEAGVLKRIKEGIPLGELIPEFARRHHIAYCWAIEELHILCGWSQKSPWAPREPGQPEFFKPDFSSHVLTDEVPYELQAATAPAPRHPAVELKVWEQREQSKLDRRRDYMRAVEKDRNRAMGRAGRRPDHCLWAARRIFLGWKWDRIADAHSQQTGRGVSFQAIQKAVKKLLDMLAIEDPHDLKRPRK